MTDLRSMDHDNNSNDNNRVDNRATNVLVGMSNVPEGNVSEKEFNARKIRWNIRELKWKIIYELCPDQATVIWNISPFEADKIWSSLARSGTPSFTLTSDKQIRSQLSAIDRLACVRFENDQGKLFDFYESGQVVVT